MNPFIEFLENKLMPPFARAAENAYIRALRNGMVTLLPFIIAGSVFLFFGSLGDSTFSTIPGFRDGELLSPVLKFFERNALSFYIPYLLSFKLIGLLASFTVAYYLAREKGLEPLGSGLISLVTMLLTRSPIKLTMLKHQLGDGATVGITGEGLQPLPAALHTGPDQLGGWWMPLDVFSASGLFLAIIIAFIVVNLVGWLKNSPVQIKMPDAVPPAVANSFSSLLPAFFCMLLMWLLVHVGGVNLHGVFTSVMDPLKGLGDSLAMVVLANLLIHLLWMVGTHGASVAGAVLWPVWIGFLQNNADAVTAGGAPEFATALPLFQFFVWLGGSGATLGLVIAMFRARSKSVSSLKNIALWPAIFNINEPLIFGLPICLNPIFLLPFVLTPILLGAISWGAVKLGLITAPYLGVPWILPAPIGAFFCTGGDWRAFVLCLINIAIATAIYYPFLRRYDRLMLKEEQAKD